MSYSKKKEKELKLKNHIQETIFRIEITFFIQITSFKIEISIFRFK